MELERLKRVLERERRAREEAERLLETKASELYDTVEKLRRQIGLNEGLIAAIEMAGDGIALTDARGQFTFMNGTHKELFGYESDDLIGCHWSVLYEPAERQRFDEEIIPTLARQGTWRGIAVGVSKAGTPVFQEVSLTSLGNGSMICATRDVSDRLNREAQARELEVRLLETEQNAARRILSQAIAHDFNNLISAINGYALLMQADLAGDPTNRSRAQAIEQAADQAAGIVASLDPSQEEEEQAARLINLISLMRTTLEISEAMRPVGIRVITQFPDHAFAVADDVLLSRCLLNVLKNALEAMEGQGRLLVKIARSASPALAPDADCVTIGPQSASFDWVLEITDDGPGMERAVMDRIFDPFFTTKTRKGGTGIGMQSLKLLSESLSVPVEVESAVGAGTTIRLFLLERAVDDTRPRELGGQPAADMDPGIRVLLAEDDPLVGAMLCEVLQVMAATVTWHADGPSTLRALRQDPDGFDLLLTDYSMPRMKGDDLIRRARTIRPNLPAILISGEIAFLSGNHDADAVLQKPISPADLKFKIAGVLANHPKRSGL